MTKSQEDLIKMENKKEEDLINEVTEKIEVMEFSNNIMIISMVFVICEFVLCVSNVIDMMTYLIFCTMSYCVYFYNIFKII